MKCEDLLVTGIRNVIVRYVRYSLEIYVFQLRSLLPSLTSLSSGRRNLCYRIMDHHRERTLTFLARLGRKQRPAVGRSPTLQTGPSTNPCIGSPDRTLTYSILFSQSLNSQTNLSFPFSLTSPQTRGPLVTMRGFVFDTADLGLTITISSGRSFYDR